MSNKFLFLARGRDIMMTMKLNNSPKFQITDGRPFPIGDKFEGLTKPKRYTSFVHIG
jgi:hypothetical protein